MPLYEYQCPKDGRFEVIRKFSDPPLTTCPTCGSEIQKLASAPAFHLKGTGWYVTDYAKKPSAEGKSAEGKAAESKPSDSKAAEGKSDSGSGKGAADGAGSSKDAASATAASTSKKTG